MNTNIYQLFSKENGNADNYRIPSIVKTKKGTLIACSDERFFTGGDNPNRIDKVVRRSLDNGKTWEKQFTIVEEVGTSKEFASAAIDPCMAYDESNDAIYMLYSHTPAGVGILSATRGLGEDDMGNKIIYGKDTQYIVKEGHLFENGKDSGMVINERGDIEKDGQYICNCNIKDGEMYEEETFYLMLCISYDDGLTWTKPINLNSQTKDKKMSFIGACPGNGIVIKNGKNKGRIILPIYYNMAKSPILMLSCAVIYSDDKGKTWTRGKSPNATCLRPFVFKTDKFVLDNYQLTESQVVELANGDLKIFMRNHALKKQIATAISHDGGQTWNSFHFEKKLIQNICQCSVINAVDDGKDVLVFLNGANKKKRQNGVIRLSYDEGKTWKYSACIKKDWFIYSSMVQMDNGNIAILYEPTIQHETIDYIELSFDWIKENSTNE